MIRKSIALFICGLISSLVYGASFGTGNYLNRFAEVTPIGLDSYADAFINGISAWYDGIKGNTATIWIKGSNAGTTIGCSAFYFYIIETINLGNSTYKYEAMGHWNHYKSYGSWERTVLADDAPPTITIIPVNYLQWWNCRIDLAADIKDSGCGIKSRYYKIGNGPEQPYANRAIIPLEYETGLYYVTFRGYDILNNYTSRTVPIRFDKIKPVITITSNQEWQDVNSYEILANATDNDSGVRTSTWSYTATGFTTFTENSRIASIDEEGRTLVEFYVEDGAGNPATVSTFVKIDRSAPRVKLVVSDSEQVIEPGQWARGEVSISLEADDSNSASGSLYVSGVESLEYRFKENPLDDTISWQQVGILTEPEQKKAMFTLAYSESGRHYLDVRASDHVGHISAVAQREINIDNTAPIAVAEAESQPDNGYWLAAESSYALVRATEETKGSGLNPAAIFWSLNPNTIDNPILELSADSFRTKLGSDENPIHTEGLNTVYFHVEDLAGNVTICEIPVNLDKTAPGLTASGNYASWQNSNIEVLLTGSDFLPGSRILPGSFQISSDGLLWQDLDPLHTGNSLLYTFYQESEHTYYFRVFDKVGHESNRVSVHIMLDKTQPELSISPSPWFKTSTAELVLSITDFAGLDPADPATFRYSFDNATFTDALAFSSDGDFWHLTISTAGLADGIRPVYLAVTDRAGNTTLATTILKLDHTPPQVTPVDIGAYLIPPATPVWTCLSSLELACSDAAGSGLDTTTLRYRYADTSFSTEDITWQNLTYSSTEPLRLLSATAFIPLLTDGAYPVYIEIADTLGQLYTATISVYRDTQPPTVTVSEPPWSRGPYQLVNLTLSDTSSGGGVSYTPARIEYLVAGGPGNWQPVNAADSAVGNVQLAIIQPAGTSGEYTVSFRATDNAGNVSLPAPSATCLVRIDRQTPLISTTPFDNLWTNAAILEIVLDGTGSPIYNLEDYQADPAGFRYGFSAAAVNLAAAELVTSEGVTTARLSALAEGQRIIYFTARDAAGNSSQVQATLKIDRTPPALARLNQEIVTGASVTIVVTDSGSGLDPASVYYGYNESDVTHEEALVTVAGNNWQIQVPAEGDGNRILTITAADQAGNSILASFPVTIDQGGPEIILTAPNGWQTRNAVITAAASDALSSLETGGWWYVQLGKPNEPYIEENWQPYTTVENGELDTIQYTLSAEGIWRVWFKVYDDGGLEGIQSVVVAVDTLAPLITLSGGLNDWTAVTSAQLSAEATDANSGLDAASWEYRLGSTWLWQAGAEAAVTTQGATTVFFRISDLAGNQAVASAVVKLDTTAPLITSFTPAEKFVTSVLTLGTPQAADSFSGVNTGSWEYRLDAAPTWLPLSRTVDVSTLAEGPHQVEVRVQDLLGNTASVLASFIIDRVAPVLTSVVLSSGGNPVEDNSYIRETQLRVNPDFTDNTQLPERPLTLQYVRQSGYTDSPDFNSATEVAAGEFNLGGLSEGLNYIFLCIRDYAGNLSAVWTRIIRVDASSPGCPEIRGISHPVAEDEYAAVALTDAVFLLVPGGGGVSGISHYTYSLEKGAEVYSSGSISENRLEFTALPDNEALEYYLLKVKAVGGNGQASPEADYRFRIDTAPPQNLKVTSSTHANSNLYYNSRMASFKWNRPLDFTGIKSYSYKSGTAAVLPPEIPEDFLPTVDWQVTEKTSLALDLVVVGGAAAGQVWLAVCAEDYAGNRQYSQLAVRFDLESPLLGAVNVQPDPLAKEATLFWPEPADNVAPERIEILLAAEYGSESVLLTETLVMQPLAGSFTFQGLSEDFTYRAYVQCFDNAGNSVTKLIKFTLYNVLDIADTPVPFSLNLQGFTITGAYSTDPARCEAFLNLADSLHFRLLSDGVSTAVSSLALDNLLFSEPGGKFVSGGFTTGESFLLTLAGYELQGSGLTVSAEGGLTFTTLSYLGAISATQSLNFIYQAVSISAPPQVLISSVTSLAAEAFSFSSATGWVLPKVTSTGFDQEQWQLESGLIDTSGIHAYIIEDAQPHFSLVVSTLGISPGGEVLEGRISGGFILEAGGNSFLVEEALLRGDKIIILKAKLMFVDGVTTDEVTLENFSIDLDGNLAEESGFTSSPFTFNDSNRIFTVTKLGFLANNLIITQGRVLSGGFDLPLSGARLETGGLSYDLEITIPFFETWLSGYRVTSEQARITPVGLLLMTAVLYLPEIFGGGSRILNGLLLSLEDSTVLVAGNSNSEFSLETGYGSEVTIHGLSLDTNGLTATKVLVPPPPFAGDELLVFPSLGLVCDGSFAASQPQAPGGALNLGGFPLPAGCAVFDGRQLIFAQVEVSLPAECNPEVVEFENLQLDYNTVVSPGILNSRLYYSYADWFFDLAGLKLSTAGLSGTASLQLPQAFGNRTVTFNTFRLFSDGSCQSGPAAGDFFFRLAGWKVKGQELVLNGANLTVSNGTVRLYSLMGGGELFIPQIVLNSAGELISCGIGETEVSFKATNGFNVAASRYTFLPSGLTLTGQLYFPAALGTSAFVSSAAIRLEDDGAVLLENYPGPVTYHVAGWNVTAEDISFDRDGLFIGMSRMAVLNTVTLNIPDIRFYPDGDMQIAGLAPEGFSKSLGGFNLGVTDVTLNNEGLNVKSYITLPPFFEGASIYFDKLTIRPDGTLITEGVVEEFGFTLDQFHFSFQDIEFTNDRFRIGSAIITLPPSAGSREIRFSNFEILNDGSLVLGGFNLDPFELWGYIFHIQNISFTDGIVGLQGSITLPTDFFIDQLAGVTLTINSFRIGTDGTIHDFSVALNETLIFPLYNTWELQVSNIELDRNLLKVTSGKLFFPAELGIEAVTINNLVINMLTRDVDLGNITISGITKEYNGLVFTLDTLVLSEERGCELTGSVVLLGTIPADFYGLSLTVDMFQIRPDFSIGDISASLNNINRTLFDSCQLTDASLGCIKTEENFLLQCTGGLEFGSSFPQGIAGKSVNLHDFTIDVVTGEILNFSASAQGLAYNLFNLCEVTDSNLTLTKNTLSGRIELNVSGILTPSATFPDCLAGERLVLEQFTIDTAGSVLAFRAALNITEPKQLFGGIYTRGLAVTVGLDETGNDFIFDLSGQILLDESFPTGLAHATFTISELTLDGRGNLLSLDVSGAFPTQPLFGAFSVENGLVRISLGETGLIETSVSGLIRFTDLFPSGLAGEVLSLSEFRIDTQGRILAFNASAGPLEFDLFGLTRVAADNISLLLDESSGALIGNVSGAVYLSSLFPEELRQDPVTLNTFTFDTAGGITAFDATLTLPGDRELIGGLLLRNGSIHGRLSSGAVVFDVEGGVVLPAGFPQGLGGKEIRIEALRFDSHGNILFCNINTNLSDVLLFNTIRIVSGQFSLLQEGNNDLVLEISGLLQFTSVFPQGIRDEYLTLHTLRINSAGEIIALDAVSSPLTIDLFGLTTMTETIFTLARNSLSGAVDIGVSGKLLLGAGFPAALQQDPLVINTFTLDTTGAIRNFEATLDLAGERNLFNALTLSQGSLTALLTGQTLEFTLGGLLTLSSSFPAGLAGTQIEFIEIRFDQHGNILACDLLTTLNDQLLFGVLPLENASLRVTASQGKDVLIDVSCNLKTPANFPEGLNNRTITVTTFRISSAGKIVAIEAGINNLSTPLFGVVDFVDASLSLRTSATYGLLIDVSGTILMPEFLKVNLPNGQTRLPIAIEKLTLSPQNGIIDFRAALTKAVDFNLFAGIRGRFLQLSLGLDGFSLKGDLLFPQDFPADGLAGRVIELSNFAMDWHGNITDIQANLPQVSIDLLGFNVLVENLSVDKDQVKIEYATLTLPDALGNRTIGFRNAGFDYKGNFFGEVVLPYIDFEFAGCRLIMNQPDLDFVARVLSFSSVFLELPASIGGQKFEVFGVTISATAGLQVAGGTFSMPDFTIAGGLWFKDIFISFIMDGSTYSIEGGGAVYIPGVGEVGTRLGLTNLSQTYPIGLKYAELWFITDGLGIPVGNTGIFINGLEGGVAFGPPGSEMPPEVRHLFGPDGMRIKVGVYMRDISGLIKGNTKVWINIDNWDWAVKGDLSLFYGVINASLIASITGHYGFYAALYVQIAFVRGSAYIHIWDERGRTYLCGAINAELAIPKGIVLGIWPSSDDYWLGGIGVEFGDFKDGSNGFKAYARLELVGEVGVFITKEGKYGLGSVKEYVLKDGGIQGSSRSAEAPAYSRNSRGAVTLRDTNQGQEVRKLYSLSVPGRGAVNTASQPTSRSAGATRSVAPTVDPFSERVEKIFFVVRYSEGDPVVTAASPSGVLYTAATPGVEILHTSLGLIMAVANPEAGDWQLLVSNLYAGQQYEIAAYGKNSLPQLKLVYPRFSGELAGSEYLVGGLVDSTTGTIPSVTLYLARDNYSLVGEQLATVTANPDGSFQYALDTTFYPDGEYYLFAQAYDGSFTGNKEYAPGSIVIRNGNALLAAPQNLFATANDATSIELAFTNPNKARSAGYYLYLEHASSGTTKRINLGNLTNTSLSGLEPDITYYVQVTAYDLAGNESPASNVVAVYTAPATSVINDFTLNQSVLNLTLPAGASLTQTLGYTTLDPTQTGTAFDYADYQLLTIPEWLTLSFNAAYWDLIRGSGELAFTLATQTLPGPGNYMVEFALRNMGNRQLTHTLTINLTVQYPQPEITGVTPQSWNNLQSASLTVTGSHFLPGTRLYIEDRELVIQEQNEYLLRATVPAGIAAGTNRVSVAGPTGLTATVSVLIVEPTYTVVGLKTSTYIAQGASDSLVFTIHGRNLFQSTATFCAVDVPAGWNVQLDKQTIGIGEYITATVMVPADAQLQEYLLGFVSDKADLLPAQITVQESTATLLPVISSLARDYGYPGEELTIFGYGFGAGGIVTLGDTPLTILAYADDRISVQPDANATSGELIVTTDIGSSAPVFYVLKQLGFSLYTSSPELSAQPGDHLNVQVDATGYAEWINFTVDSGEIPVQLDKSGLKPNGSVSLSLEIPAGTAFGNYPVTLNAVSGGYMENMSFILTIGESFLITTGNLPGGMVEVFYTTLLTTINGRAPLAFSVSAGSLPPGLSITPAGTLSGRPAQSGSYSFTVCATDALQHTTLKSLTLVIADNAWSQPYKDSGRGAYNPVAAPGTAARKWTSAATGSQPLDLITGAGRIFVRTVSGITVINSENGTPVYTWTGQLGTWLYQNGTLFLLESGGRLTALEARFGGLRWERSGVTRLAALGDLLYLQEADGLKLVDLQGQLCGEIPVSIPGELILVQDNQLYALAGRDLQRLSDANWTLVYRAAEPILDAAADSQGFALLTGAGTLLLLDNSCLPLCSTETGLSGGKILLGSERLYVAGSSETRGYKRSSLTALFTLAANTDTAALAQEKLFIAGTSGLSSLNGYTGAPIWSNPGTYTDLALAGEILYALAADGSVQAYHGRSNPGYPETTFSLNPAEPNGERGYYTLRPELTLTAADTESLVDNTFYKIGDAEWQNYSGSLLLPEGQYPVSSYSVDNHGYREPDHNLNLLVDITEPLTSLSVAGTRGNLPYYTGSVTLTLEASDNLSGVQTIYYIDTNGMQHIYSAPLVYDEQGLYCLTYYSKDRAGNYDQARTFSFALDLADPLADALTYSEPGAGVVYLNASDSQSGIARIEYTRDNDPRVYTYLDPVVYTEAGTHTTTYRAIDNAGRMTAWQTVIVITPEMQAGSWIENISYAYWKPGRELVRNIKPGNSIYAPSNGSKNKIQNLPDYLEGADYLMFHNTDKDYAGSDFVSFDAVVDIEVYILKHSTSPLTLSGWSLVAEDYPVEPDKYFPGGADIYKKTFSRGERIVIPGSDTKNGWANLVFVQFAQSNNLKIVSPQPGSSLHPASRIRYTGLVEDIAYEQVVWEYTLDGLTTPLGSSLSGDFDIPFCATDTSLELTLGILDSEGNRIGEKRMRYPVINHVTPGLSDPAQGTEIIAGSEGTLTYSPGLLTLRQECSRELVQEQTVRSKILWPTIPPLVWCEEQPPERRQHLTIAESKAERRIG